MSNRTAIKLGDRVRDRITGFEGIVIGITEWLYQCRRPIVQATSLNNDGKPTGSESFDEDQLEIIESGAFSPKAVEPVEAPEKTGGPRDTPSRQIIPERRR